MVVGTVIGAAAISGLHAQARATRFISSPKSTSRTQRGYGKEYAPRPGQHQGGWRSLRSPWKGLGGLERSR